MDRASAAARVVRPIDAGLLAAAAQAAAEVVGGVDEPSAAIEAAVDAFYDAVDGVLPSVFVLEHGRIWLVAQRGYAVVPDGITVDRGITGRAIRLGRPQLAPDVRADPDYVAALPGVVSELAVPLRSGRNVVGVLNVESERRASGRSCRRTAAARTRAHAAGGVDAVEPNTRSRRARSAVRPSRQPPGAARHRGARRSVPSEGAARDREPDRDWSELGAAAELAAWHASDTAQSLTLDDVEIARVEADPSVVCQVLELEAREPGRDSRSVVWLPLRANAGELGALVGVCREAAHVDPVLLDTAAVLAAHVAASLDAAFALQRERQSAVTDPLTGILNRRGFEERLEQQLDCRAGAARSAQPPRHRLRRLQGDQRPRRARVRRRAAARGRRRPRSRASGGRRGSAARRRRVRRHVSRRRRGRSRGARRPDPDASRRGPDRRGLPAPHLGRHLDVSLRRRQADDAPARGRPGAVRGEGGRQGSDRLVPRAHAPLLRPPPRGDQCARRPIAGGGARAREQCSPTRWRPPRRSRPRRPSKASASVSARRSSSSSARQRAPRPACWATTSSTRPSTRFARSRSVTRPRTGSPTSRSRPRCCGRGEPRAVSFVDGDVDPSEAFILRDLGMNALLMLPIRVGGRVWGLIELYEMRLRRFAEDDIAVAQFLVSQASDASRSSRDANDPRGVRASTSCRRTPARRRVPRTR